MTTSHAYAPRAESGAGAGRLAVIAAGLATTALALFGVHVLNQATDDFALMGWYAYYVIPIGAVLVGAVASSGYAIGSWLRGVKVCGGLLFGIVALQIGAYFAGQYLEFSSFELAYEDGSAVGFFHYFDFSTRAIAWVQDDGSTGAALGAWGYGLRVLEVLGFSAGSLVAPAALRGKPYCDACSVYMRKQHTAWIPASVPAERIRKKNTEAHAAHTHAQESALEGALQHVESLGEVAERGDAAAFKGLMNEVSGDRKQTEKLPVRVFSELFHCPSCEAGELKVMLRAGQGDQIQDTELSRVPLGQYFVRGVLQTQPS